MTKKIFLFDLDGVLIQPRGYRAASASTLRYFLEKMGLDANLPGEDGLAHFEASSITNEWDMVPLSLGMIINTALHQSGQEIQSQGSLQECFKSIHDAGCKPVVVDYHSQIERLLPWLGLHVIPCDALLMAFSKGLALELFNFIPRPAIQELLGKSRDIHFSQTTRIFQHFILGSSTFQEVYQIEPEFPVESYLTTMDKVLLSKDNHNKLLQGMNNGKISCAGITARPSSPPIPNKNGSAIYSPEAELARDLLNLGEMPVMGYGEMSWLANRVNMAENELLKPSPVHAIAALGAARGMEMTTLLARLESELCQDISLSTLLHELIGSELVELHIFEDSPNGILSCQRAFQKEINNGRVNLIKHGIAVHAIKRNALEALGAEVDENINQALQHVLAS